ncbi:putative YTH domain, ankyrin repeat-containing domain, PGG domain-containing protein [Helianthus annuus]|nr:putative YTH domain, ankyrin repeat-containing domain, PGG domain-containing protein [Helianthus annuus]KAJ0497376.1 putative YTH domain, ankyrin repeat-containing domain, PGG domain-containing protein [Helianthus annuus]KAJ0663390.1 putative YTH domain, ankyrin repeat-containing domain, PGG domain-containing protein [Helianthus annuus]KAJ0670888.1 putative YTH domain, ankyrin repeat-containing domain, PGG domain-containing protein [Helianthus annuus]KAJ0857818.1 putative YTH domain, ankyrin
MNTVFEDEKDLEKGSDSGSNPVHRKSPSPSRRVIDSYPAPSPRAPALVVSNSGRLWISSSNAAKLFGASSSSSSLPNTPGSCMSPSYTTSNSGKSLLGSYSGKSLMGQGSRKKYVQQVTGKHNDTELHLAARRGDVMEVRRILDEINEQMLRTMKGDEFDDEVAETTASVVNEMNELGETALFTAAERGFIEVVKELLPYTTKEGLALKNRSGFDTLHIAAREGHREIVKVFLDHDPGLSKTVSQSNSTPLTTAAARGHSSVVDELLSRDSSIVYITRSNGKNALHLAARQGHVDIVNALLKKDPLLARKTDKKGQTSLHMAVKGVSSEVVRLLLQADPAIVMLPDKFSNTALHVATRKKRVEIVNELLLLRDTNVNALTRDHKTALDIVENLPFSEETSEIKEILIRYGARQANDLNQPKDELRQTVTEIRNNVHNQVEQARKTNRNMSGIAKELRKLHREGINNATNSVTVVAVLFATVAFAAIFTVPGGDDNDGVAVMVHALSFQVFFISNAVALFTSLAVVVVQITVVRGEIKSERRVVGVINKLMWLASVCTTVAFISSSYIVMGRHHRWAANLVTVFGGVTMAGVLGVMTYFVVKSKKLRRVRRKSKGSGWRNTEFSDDDVNRIYAI